MKVRVTVTDTWDTVTIEAGEESTIGELKKQALAAAVGRDVDGAGYVTKYRGALVSEGARLDSVGIPEDGALIVLPGQKHPVR